MTVESARLELAPAVLETAVLSSYTKTPVSGMSTARLTGNQDLASKKTPHVHALLYRHSVATGEIRTTASAPYAPPATVLYVVNALRDRGLTTPITGDVLLRVGISDSLG